jgi:hypothetical protein
MQVQMGRQLAIQAAQEIEKLPMATPGHAFADLLALQRAQSRKQGVVKWRFS